MLSCDALRRYCGDRDQSRSFLCSRFRSNHRHAEFQDEKAENGERIEKHLLITRYDAARAARGEMLKIEDVLEILSIPLLGVIPESQEVLRASNLGSPVTLSNKTSAPARAYIAAARKLKGEEAAIGMPGERGLFGKLFGRRAA